MDKNKYSAEIAEAIDGFLTEDDWRFHFRDDVGIFEFKLNVKGNIKNIDYRVLVHDSSYTVYVICPVYVEKKNKRMMAEMAEFICRANYGLRNGNFEFDMRDGEIRYKVFVDCAENSTPDEEILKNSMYIPASMFERYSPGIEDIIFRSGKADEAVEKCEKAYKFNFRELLSFLEDEGISVDPDKLGVSFDDEIDAQDFDSVKFGSDFSDEDIAADIEEFEAGVTEDVAIDSDKPWLGFFDEEEED